MSRPNLGPSDKARLTAIEAQLHNLARTGDPRSMAMRDLSDAALVPVANGQVPTYDFASGLWKPGAPRAIGAHVQHPAAVPVADNTNVPATGMVVEHDSGGVAGTDRLTVPAGGAGVWHVEVHADWDYKFPDPHEFIVTLLLKRGASTAGLWDTGVTSFTRSKQFGTHFPAQVADFFQVRMYQLSGGVSRNCQISCLSGYRIGS